MPLLDAIGSTHCLHMWLGIPIMIRIFTDEYDPSGRVFFSPQARILCCGIIVCTILVTYFRNPARRLIIDEEEDDEMNALGVSRKRPSLLSRVMESLDSTISSSSSSMFRNALFVSILFWFSWPSKNPSLNYAVGAVDHDHHQVCDADDTTCRIANHYGPPICCITPSFCDAKAHNWIYQQGGTAQAYKPDVPFNTTICDPELIRESKMRHKVATWPYSRSNRKLPPELKIKLNLLRCTNGGVITNSGNKGNNKNKNIDSSNGEGNDAAREEVEEGSVATAETEPQDSNCCCYPLLSGGSHENATIEIWQTRPDGTYSSLRPGNQEGECRAKWVARVDPNDHVFETSNPLTVEFTTVAPGSTGSVGGLGPGGWELFPYGPPVIHILVRPGFDGVSPLLVDVPVSIHHKTLEERKFTWTDWRGPAWVKSKGNPDQPSYNITSWEPDLESHSVSISVDLFLQEDKEYSVGYISSTRKLMCPSLFYGMPSAFFLEPISVCGKYLLDYFDL